MLDKDLMNWNILVVKGKEHNRDFVSSGERKRNKPISFSDKVRRKEGGNLNIKEGDNPVKRKSKWKE